MHLGFIAIPIILVVTLCADSPDLKRNQRVQKLAARSMKAQSAYSNEMKSWELECATKGLILSPIVGMPLLDCMMRPQQPQAQLQRRPLATPSETQSSVTEQKEKDTQIDAQAKAKEKK